MATRIKRIFVVLSGSDLPEPSARGLYRALLMTIPANGLAAAVFDPNVARWFLLAWLVVVVAIAMWAVRTYADWQRRALGILADWEIALRKIAAVLTTSGESTDAS